MGTSQFIFGTTVFFEGPKYFLRDAKELMEKCRREYGYYPTTLEELESLYKDNPALLREFDRTKGKDYTYKIVEAKDDFFRIVSENDKGLRNYEITSEMKSPMWIFKDDMDRENTKKALMKKMQQASSLDRRSIVYDFQYFPDEDVKVYLINILKNRKEDETVLDNASDTLSYIVTEKDSFLIPDLMEILNLKPSRGLNVKLNIVRIFGVLKDPSTLPVLRKIAATEKDVHFYPIKTIAENVIKEIEAKIQEGFKEKKR